ncbi:hypothetical protein Naga_100248g9 [Nannochloropsis gaditana]|uniref:Uncharacterized protein n=1 Tax=Nannochloropsis gaditana TaxID=72520 RepID=W7TNV4_9STRA|nr:hypothetical protein Naga_100248g9 [Nannochloropsis gaditana]
MVEQKMRFYENKICRQIITIRGNRTLTYSRMTCYTAGETQFWSNVLALNQRCWTEYFFGPVRPMLDSV